MQPEVIRPCQPEVEPSARYHKSAPLKVPKHATAHTRINCQALQGRILNARKRTRADPNPFDRRPETSKLGGALSFRQHPKATASDPSRCAERGAPPCVPPRPPTPPTDSSAPSATALIPDEA